LFNCKAGQCYTLRTIFTRATLAIARVLAVVVCLSVRLSQVGFLPKRLNVESRKQHYTIAHGL